MVNHDKLSTDSEQSHSIVQKVFKIQQVYLALVNQPDSYSYIIIILFFIQVAVSLFSLKLLCMKETYKKIYIKLHSKLVMEQYLNFGHAEFEADSLNFSTLPLINSANTDYLNYLLNNNKQDTAQKARVKYKMKKRAIYNLQCDSYLQHRY